jgi:hypothetical protein
MQQPKIQIFVPKSYEKRAISYEKRTISYEKTSISYEKTPISYEKRAKQYDIALISYENGPKQYEKTKISYENGLKLNSFSAKTNGGWPEHDQLKQRLNDFDDHLERADARYARLVRIHAIEKASQDRSRRIRVAFAIFALICAAYAIAASSRQLV